MPPGQVPDQITADELKSGDIIIFYSLKSRLQTFIRGVQKVFSRQNAGHNESTHVAICVGRDLTTNKMMIAHVTEANGKMGYIYEPLAAMESREKIKDGRPFQAFRPTDPEVAEKIGHAALAVNSLPPDKQPIWSIKTAIKTFMKTAYKITPMKWLREFFGGEKPAIKNKEPHVVMNAICSLFAMNMIKMGAYKTQGPDRDKYRSELEGIRTDISPKALGKFCVESKNFQHLACTGETNAYEHAQRAIKIALHQERLKPQTGALFDPVRREFEKLTAELNQSTFTGLEKGYYLLQKMLPLLSEMDKKGKEIVLETMRDVGIYQQDVDNFKKEMTLKPAEPNLMARRESDRKIISDPSKEKENAPKHEVTFHQRKEVEEKAINHARPKR